MDTGCPRRASGVIHHEPLNKIKLRRSNDRLVSIFCPRPFVLRLYHGLLDFVIGRCGFTLHQRSGIDLILENPVDRNGTPQSDLLRLETGALLWAIRLLVLNRRRDIGVIKPVCDLSRRQPLYLPLENVLHNRRGNRVNHQLVLVVRWSQIPENHTRADKLSVPSLRIKVWSDLDGDVTAIGIVHQVLERKDKLVVCRSGLCAVIVVVDCNKANTEAGEYLLDVVTSLNILTTKTRKVFHHDAVNQASADSLHHSVEVRTLKVCAGKAVIAVFFYYGNFRVLLEVFLDEHSLVWNAVTLKFFAGNRKVAIFLW